MAALCFFVCFILKLTLVAGQSVQYVLKGRDATLFPALPGAPDDILWKHNGDKVITFDSAEERVFHPYEGRVTLNWGTAELTITDMGFEDSGEYELDAFIRDRLYRSQYMLKVLDKVSKPDIRCEMTDENGNSTYARRATLHCSSESNTPEALTFKWNLGGKSQMGQALTIALVNEDDHTEYSCTATNPLHGETSIFMANDCYTDRSPEALDIIVPIVIASLILLAFCILAWIFRHQIKRACLKSGHKDDLEKQMTVVDHKNKNEGTPLMGDIHRQETFASKHRLIQQNDFETPQKQEINQELEELRSARKVKKRSKRFTHPEHAESQTEEENDTDISEKATSPLPSQISNRQVESEGETNLPNEDLSVPKLEGGSDADSFHSSQSHAASDHKELQSLLPEPGEHESGGQIDSDREPDVHHSDHEGGQNTDAAGDSKSIHSGQEEATKNPEQAELPSQPHRQSSVSQEDKDLQHTNKGLAESNEKLSPESTVDQKPPEGPELTETQPPGQQDFPSMPGEPESGGQTESEGEPRENHSEHQGGLNTDAAGDSSSIDSGQQEVTKTPEKEGSQPQLHHQSNALVLEQDSPSEQDEPESKEQRDPHEESSPGPVVTEPQTDASHNENVTSEDREAEEPDLPNDSQMPLPQSEQSESPPQPPSQSSPPPSDDGSKSGTDDNDEKKTDPDDKLKTEDKNIGASELEAESLQQSPLQTSVPSVQDSEPKSVAQTDPENVDPQSDSDHKSKGSNNEVVKTEGAALPGAQPPPSEQPESPPQSPTQSSPASVQDSKPPHGVQTNPDPEEDNQQRDSNRESEGSDDKVEKPKDTALPDTQPTHPEQPAVDRPDQSQNPDSGGNAEEAKDDAESDSSSDKELQKQDASMEEAELPGSAKESDESTHPPASAFEPTRS